MISVMYKGERPFNTRLAKAGAMKRLIWLIVLVIGFPVGAQGEDALLFTRLDTEVGVASFYVLNADTGQERLITDSAADAGWLPDGRIWALKSLNGFSDGVGQLSVFDADTGAETIISDGVLRAPCTWTHQWSNDGQRVAFYGGITETRRLTIHNGIDETSYSPALTEDEDFVSWSPDGAYFLVSDRVQGRVRLLKSADGTALLNATSYARFSPDGRFLAYDHEGANWVYTLATEQSVRIDVLGQFAGWLWRHPTVMLQNRDEGKLWLYEANADELTTLDVSGDRLWQSPGGRYLTIFDNRPTEDSVFHLYDRETGQLKALDLGYPLVPAGWAEDESQLLLYNAFDGYRAQSVLLYDLISGDAAPILETDGEILWASHQGDWLYLYYKLSDEDGDDNTSTNRFALRHRESGVALEMDVPARSYIPRPDISTSPDGRWFTITGFDGLHLFDLTDGGDGSPDLLAATVARDDGGLATWSPDSRYLAFKAEEQLTLFKAESGTIERQPDAVLWIIGWQGGEANTMGGGDGCV